LFYSPLQSQIIRRQATNSELARTRLGTPLREAYGPTALEKLDIHRTARPNAPIFVFIHGGAWLGGEAKNYAYAAEMLVNAGAHFIALDFIAIEPARGDLRVMADQVRRAVAWVYKNAASLAATRTALYRRAFLGWPFVRRHVGHQLADRIRLAIGYHQGRALHERLV
jgi:arylformamidase